MRPQQQNQPAQNQPRASRKSLASDDINIAEVTDTMTLSSVIDLPSAAIAPTRMGLHGTEPEVGATFENNSEHSFREFFQMNNIRVIGTDDGPLFVAVDIGKRIGDFRTERTVGTVDGKYVVRQYHSDRPQSPKGILMLTKLGLYRYIFNSTSSLAVPYQEFMAGGVVTYSMPASFVERPNYVYFMYDPTDNVDPEAKIEVKIGRSMTPYERLKSLRTAKPRLQLITTIACNAVRVEPELHRIHSARRTDGEWFHFTRSELNDAVDAAWILVAGENEESSILTPNEGQ